MSTDTTPDSIGADALREALWICVEHNALHFGETHNTVVQGRAALASAALRARVQELERAVAAEREECAQVCDALYHGHIGAAFGEVRYGIAACAGGIRARGAQGESNAE